MIITANSTSLSASNLIPSGSLVFGVVSKSKSIGTGTANTYSIGDNTNTTLWGTNISTSLGTTTSSANFNVTTLPLYNAQPTIYIYPLNGTFVNQVFDVTVYYMNIISI